MISPVKITGLLNTPDRKLVGLACYDAQNVRIDRGSIECDLGFAEQIADQVGACWGGCFARFEDFEEYIAVIGDEVFVASPGDSSWTSIASGVDQSPWEFQPYGDSIFAVNAVDGLRVHKLGETTDPLAWQGPEKPARPDGSDLLTFAELKYNNGSDPDNSIATALGAATWTFEVDGAAPGSPPTLVAAVTFNTIFEFGDAYGTGGGQNATFHFECTAEFGTDIDLQWDDVFLFGAYLQDTRGTRISGAVFQVKVGGTWYDMMYGTEKQVSATQVSRVGYLTANKLDRSSRTAIQAMRWAFDIRCSLSNSVESTDKFVLTLAVGDVWPNNDNQFDVDDGPVLSKKTYAFSVYNSGTVAESDLSDENLSAITPEDNITDSSYTQITLPTGFVDGDKLRLYRKRRRDKKFVRIGEVDDTNPATIDDHYTEPELEALTEYGGISNLPPDKKPQQIGVFRSSLALGIEYDLYLSKRDRPFEYESIDDAPDPLDPSVGRSMFVDDQRSEFVRAIHGGNVLHLGTTSRCYVSYGDNPPSLVPPQVTENLGPIGYRSSCLFADGQAVANIEGIWLVRWGQFVGDQYGRLESTEMSKEIQTSYDAISPDETVVVALSRGHLYVIRGSQYLRLDRKLRVWSQGDWGRNVVAVAADHTYKTRLFTDSGGLLELGGAEDYGGTDIDWYYETGDLIVEGSHALKNIYIECVGAVQVSVWAWDGKQGATGPLAPDNVFTADPDRYSLDGFPGHIYRGTRFRIKLAGVQGDSVQKVELDLVPAGGSGSR